MYKEYCHHCKNRPQTWIDKERIIFHTCQACGRGMEQYNLFHVLDLELFDKSGWVIFDLLNELDNCLMKHEEGLPLLEEDDVRSELMQVVRDWIRKNNG